MDHPRHTPSDIERLTRALEQARASLMTARLVATTVRATDAETVEVIKRSHALIGEVQSLLAVMRICRNDQQGRMAS